MSQNDPIETSDRPSTREFPDGVYVIQKSAAGTTETAGYLWTVETITGYTQYFVTRADSTPPFQNVSAIIVLYNKPGIPQKFDSLAQYTAWAEAKLNDEYPGVSTANTAITEQFVPWE